MSLSLRWTEQATNQLGAIAEYISLASPVYAEQMVERILSRLRQAQDFPESGRRVPESARSDVRELLKLLTASSIASPAQASRSSPSFTVAEIFRNTWRADRF